MRLNVWDFGSSKLGDGHEDATAAIQAAFDAAAASAFEVNPRNRVTEVFIPGGKYPVTSLVNRVRTIAIVGEGSSQAEHVTTLMGFGGAGSNILTVGRNVDANGNLIVTTGPDGDKTVGADGTSIRHLKIKRLPGMNAITGHGLFIDGAAFVDVDDVMVETVDGNGFEILADQIATNACIFRLSRCRAHSCLGHGLHVKGGNSNAGHVESFSAEGNNRWGVYDESFLGSAYYDCHTNANGSLPDGSHRPDSGSYKFVGLSQYSALFDCYEELNNTSDFTQAPNVEVHGGNLAGSAKAGQRFGYGNSSIQSKSRVDLSPTVFRQWTSHTPIVNAAGHPSAGRWTFSHSGNVYRTNTPEVVNGIPTGNRLWATNPYTAEDWGVFRYITTTEGRIDHPFDGADRMNVLMLTQPLPGGNGELVQPIGVTGYDHFQGPGHLAYMYPRINQSAEWATEVAVPTIAPGATVTVQTDQVPWLHRHVGSRNTLLMSLRVASTADFAATPDATIGTHQIATALDRVLVKITNHGIVPLAAGALTLCVWSQRYVYLNDAHY